MFNEWNFLGMDSADCECEWSNAFVGAFWFWGADPWMQSLLCQGAGCYDWEVWTDSHRNSHTQAVILWTKALLFQSGCQVPPTRRPRACAQMARNSWDLRSNLFFTTCSVLVRTSFSELIAFIVCFTYLILTVLLSCIWVFLQRIFY